MADSQDPQVSQPAPVVAPEQANGQVASPYTYQDLQKESIKDIATNTQEPQTPAPEAAKEEPAVEVDLDTLKAQIREDLKKEFEEARAQPKIEEPAPEPTNEEKAYLEWEKQFNNQNSRPPTYLEAMRFVEDRAVEKIEARQVEQQKKQQEEQTRVQQEVQERDRSLSAIVEDEMQELYKENLMTPIKDATNPSDQGIVERNAFFNTWIEVNNLRKQQGLPEITSATRIRQFYFKPPTAQPAGSTAPVSGARSSAVPPSEEGRVDYARDIKGKGWQFFRRNPNQS